MDDVGQAFTILFVEHDLNFSEMFAEALRANGDQVVIAGSAGEAIRLAIEHAPDAVLLDLRLPDGHGYDVARTLRRECLNEQAAVVALTGMNLREVPPGEEAGVDLVLSKPVKADLLSGLLRYVRQQRGRRIERAKRSRSQPA